MTPVDMAPWNLASGVLAITAALALFAVTTLLGPDVRVVRCLSWRGRFLAYGACAWWFVRGAALVFNPLGLAPPWTSAGSWAWTLGLVLYFLFVTLGERLPPGVRERLERREAYKIKRAQQLVAKGEIGRAAAVAEGADLGDAQAYAVGLDPATAERLHELPDPYAP